MDRGGERVERRHAVVYTEDEGGEGAGHEGAEGGLFERGAHVEAAAVVVEEDGEVEEFPLVRARAIGFVSVFV